MVLGVFIDLPHVVEPLAGKDIPGGEHGGHHGMVLVVVFMHAIAAYHVKGGKTAFQVATDRHHVIAVVFIINWIGFCLAHYSRVDDIVSCNETDLRDFAFC